MQELPTATVAMPAATLMPFAAGSQFVMSPSATSQAPFISELSVADWQTLVEAGSTPTVLDPAARTQSTASVPVTFAGINAPVTKRVVLLVAKRPSTSTVSQPQNGITMVQSVDDSAGKMTSSRCPSVPTNFLASSAAEANSVVVRLTTLRTGTDLPSQELVTSCAAGSAGQFGSSGHLELLEGHSESSEGQLGSSECNLGASYGHLVSSGDLASSLDHSQSSESHFGSLDHLGSSEGHLMSSEGHTGSSEGQFGSPLHDSHLSSLESKSSVVLRCASAEAEGQDMVDEDEVQTSAPVIVDHHSVVTQLKQFLDVSDLYSCS